MFSKTLFCFLTMLLQVVPFVQANSLTIKNWQDDDKPTASKTTKSNIYIEKANAAQNIANTPAESSAAKCASKTVRIEWQPKWVYSGVGGVNIPRAALSSDQSLLAIIENYENSNGEFSSMIILLNTYNNRAVRVIDLPRRKANRLIFLPGMEKLAVACNIQKQTKQPSTLLLIDCTEGEVVGMNDAFRGEVKKLAASRDGANVFALTESPSELLMIKQDEWNNEAVKLNTADKTISSIAVNKGNVLLASTKGEIRIHDAVTGQFFNRISLPADFRPDMTITSEVIDDIALLEQRGKAYALSGKRYKKFFDQIYGTGAYIGSNKTFVTLNRSGNLIFFTLPDYEFKNKSVNAGHFKPKTKGSILQIWSLKPLEVKSKRNRRSSKQLARLLILDSHGNIYYLYKTGRRWKKEQIIEAKK